MFKMGEIDSKFGWYLVKFRLGSILSGFTIVYIRVWNIMGVQQMVTVIAHFNFSSYSGIRFFYFLPNVIHELESSYRGSYPISNI